MDLLLHLNRDSLAYIHSRISFMVHSDRHRDFVRKYCPRFSNFDESDLPFIFYIFSMVEELLDESDYLKGLRNINSLSLVDISKNDRLVKLITKLCQLWDLIDFDSLGSISWEDFTDFCLFVGRLHFKENISQVSISFSCTCRSFTTLPVYQYGYIPSLNFMVGFDSETPNLRFFKKPNILHGTMNISRDFLKLIHPKSQQNLLPKSKRALFIYSKSKPKPYKPPERFRITALCVVDSKSCMVLSISSGHLVVVRYRCTEEILFGEFRPHHYELTQFFFTEQVQSGIRYSQQHDLLITWSGFSSKHAFRLWKVSSDYIVESFEVILHSSLVIDLCEVYSEVQGQYYASCSSDRKVLLWRIHFQRIAVSSGNLNVFEDVSSSKIDVAPGTSTTSSGRQIPVENREISKIDKYELFGHRYGIKKLVYAPFSALLVGAGYDFDLYIWDPFSQMLLSKCTGHIAPLVSICIVYAPSEHLASVDERGIVKIWRLVKGQGQVLLTWPLHGNSFQPDHEDNPNSDAPSGSSHDIPLGDHENEDKQSNPNLIVNQSKSNNKNHGAESFVHFMGATYDGGQSFAIRSDALYVFTSEGQTTPETTPVNGGLGICYGSRRLLIASRHLLGQLEVENGKYSRRLNFMEQDHSALEKERTRLLTLFQRSAAQLSNQDKTRKKMEESGKSDLSNQTTATAESEEPRLNRHFINVSVNDEILTVTFDNTGKKMYLGTYLGKLYIVDTVTLEVLAEVSNLGKLKNVSSGSLSSSSMPLTSNNGRTSPNEIPENSKYFATPSISVAKFLARDGFLLLTTSQGSLWLLSGSCRSGNPRSASTFTSSTVPSSSSQSSDTMESNDLPMGNASMSPDSLPLVIRSLRYDLVEDHSIKLLSIHPDLDIIAVASFHGQIWIFQYSTFLFLSTFTMPPVTPRTMLKASVQGPTIPSANSSSTPPQTYTLTHLQFLSGTSLLLLGDSLGRLSFYHFHFQTHSTASHSPMKVDSKSQKTSKSSVVTSLPTIFYLFSCSPWLCPLSSSFPAQKGMIEEYCPILQTSFHSLPYVSSSSFSHHVTTPLPTSLSASDSSSPTPDTHRASNGMNMSDHSPAIKNWSHHSSPMRKSKKKNRISSTSSTSLSAPSSSLPATLYLLYVSTPVGRIFQLDLTFLVLRSQEFGENLLHGQNSTARHDNTSFSSSSSSSSSSTSHFHQYHRRSLMDGYLSTSPSFQALKKSVVSPPNFMPPLWDFAKRALDSSTSPSIAHIDLSMGKDVPIYLCNHWMVLKHGKAMEFLEFEAEISDVQLNQRPLSPSSSSSASSSHLSFSKNGSRSSIGAASSLVSTPSTSMSCILVAFEDGSIQCRTLLEFSLLGESWEYSPHVKSTEDMSVNGSTMNQVDASNENSTNNHSIGMVELRRGWSLSLSPLNAAPKMLTSSLLTTLVEIVFSYLQQSSLLVSKTALTSSLRNGDSKTSISRTNDLSGHFGHDILGTIGDSKNLFEIHEGSLALSNPGDLLMSSKPDNHLHQMGTSVLTSTPVAVSISTELSGQPKITPSFLAVHVPKTDYYRWKSSLNADWTLESHDQLVFQTLDKSRTDSWSTNEKLDFLVGKFGTSTTPLSTEREEAMLSTCSREHANKLTPSANKGGNSEGVIPFSPNPSQQRLGSKSTERCVRPSSAPSIRKPMSLTSPTLGHTVVKTMETSTVVKVPAASSATSTASGAPAAVSSIGISILETPLISKDDSFAKKFRQSIQFSMVDNVEVENIIDDVSENKEGWDDWLQKVEEKLLEPVKEKKVITSSYSQSKLRPGSATPQTASSGKFRVVRDNISKQHVELVHTVNRYGPYKAKDMWSFLSMFHRLSVEELIRRSSIPSEEACRSDFEEPATREILQERIRIHYITISRDYDLNQHEAVLDDLLDSCTSEADNSLSMDGIIEIFFAHTSASSRFFIHCFVLLSLALKNLFSKAKVKEWDDVFLHRNKNFDSKRFFMMIPTPPHISRGFQSWEVEEKLIVDISTLLDLWVHDPNGGLLVEDFVEIAQGMVSPLTLVHCRPLVILGKLISIRLKRKLRSELNSQLFRNILLLAMKMVITTTCTNEEESAIVATTATSIATNANTVTNGNDTNTSTNTTMNTDTNTTNNNNSNPSRIHNSSNKDNNKDNNNKDGTIDGTKKKIPKKKKKFSDNTNK